MAKKILIVDDQPEVSRLLEIVLRQEGRELLFAENGEAGLEAALLHAPDVILLDLMMPGELDGFEVARRLKSNPVSSRPYIIVMTAKVREQDRQAAFAAGADEYITKPFDVFDLKNRVDMALD